MVKQYFKTSFKYLWKQRSFAAINLAGLSVSLCACFLALLYVNFELNYDTFNEKAGRIYRLVTDVETSTGVSYESTSAPMAAALSAAFPEIEDVTRVFLDYLIVQRDAETSNEENVAYADPSLLSMFSFPLRSGNPVMALDAPFKVVLTEAAARKYFGSTDCLGETLLLSEAYPATITGIIDIPYNSHFRAEILISMSTLVQEWNPSLERNWTRFGFYTYVQLSENYDPAALAAKLPDFVSNHLSRSGAKYSLAIEPLTEVYLHGLPRGSRYGSSVSGDIQNVYIFSIVAAFILIIACFNFINLTTAFSVQRGREVGVRKVFGATRRQLVWQFLTDAVLLCVLAFCLAALLSAFLLPLFNQLAGKMVSAHILQHLNILGWLLLIAVALGGLSGIYPALFLARFQPVHTLQGRFISGSGGALIRKALVLAQFSVSIILITTTLVVYSQLDYMKNEHLGFKKDHRLVVDFHFDERVSKSQQSVKQRLAGLPGVDLVSFSSSVPGRANRKFLTAIENADGQAQEFLSDVYFIDSDFLNQYEIAVVAGRAFFKNLASDIGQTMLINEAAVRSLGYRSPAEALGKRFTQRGSAGLIIGVVNDFHFHSLREQVQPLTLRIAPQWFTFLTLKISSGDLQDTIVRLKNRWQELAPGKPFIYSFVDEVYNTQYLEEERFGQLFTCFASLAILISCLGLLGLSAYSTARRTKEIGIRKVLGASAFSVVTLLTKEVLMLMAVAFVIATAVAGLAMDRWLQDFAYRIDLSWRVFALAGLTAASVAWITISLQTLRAAVANPVNSLRTE